MQGKEEQTSKPTEEDSTLDPIAAVHYTPTEDRESQIRRYDTVKETDAEREADDWNE